MGKLKVSLMLTVLIFVLAACGGTTETKETGEVEGAEAPKTVEITDAHGTIDVPVNPEKVVALDNRTFETLAAWDIELAAAPIGLLPAESPYAKDSDIADVGMHFEPNLEAIAGVDPDVVIVGQRFADYYEDIKKLVPNAAVIDLYIDIPEDTGTPGEILVKGLTDTTLTLGKIFDKNEEAAQLVADLDNSIDGVKSAYNGEDTIMSVIVSGGDIGFSAPISGRVYGPMYDIFGWTPALEVEKTIGDHQGDEVSVEAIAESNPDWLFVLDRDAPLAGAEGAVPAADVIDNAPALQKTTAVKEKNIVYAPNDTYLNESIQTYAEMFNDIAQALKK
ncbi:siderophore ABC transporter substrate-binding protein [Exiguobacterium alkaliphilum]|uniref:siderophore ABC transporter substrate-binding protein n=1 Tax=Exiguobacterium alkaliphilum TaxID=1428684 RepID=UPI001BA5F139|nr:siderophore ABC transporter substrate-binding protein [Exiguobacterium alkaliphilum]QUE87277.1 siderophore ABC transporter substrate-binding protein [Exiguobacterium alkaliphilum]